MTFLDHLQNMYRLYIERRGARSSLVERRIGLQSVTSPTVDGMRNEPESYRIVFDAANGSFMTDLLESLLNSMKGKRFEECNDELAGLRFVQAISITALSLRQGAPSDRLGKFARDFDRMDVPEIRHKLYNSAQEEG